MNAILATTYDFLLALKGTMPWTLSEDLKDISKMDMSFFRKMTKGSKLVMGYNTWLSLNETPLPGRDTHYIITSKKLESTDKIKFLSLKEFKENHINETNLWCIGGAKLYSELIPLCKEVYWNEIIIAKKKYNKLIGNATKKERLFLDESLKNFLKTRGNASYAELESYYVSDGKESYIMYHHFSNLNLSDLNILIQK